jgi:hypothetical protein
MTKHETGHSPFHFQSGSAGGAMAAYLSRNRNEAAAVKMREPNTRRGFLLQLLRRS